MKKNINGISKLIILSSLLAVMLGCTRFLYKKAIEDNSIKSLEIFVEKHPDHILADSAKVCIEALIWTEAIQKNEIPLYENYLKSFSQGKYLTEAKDSIEKLIWKEAIQKNEITLYYNYIDKYPNGKFQENAKRKITTFSPEIREFELKKRNKELTKTYLREYIDKFPKGDYSEEAKCRLKIYKFNIAFGVINDNTDEQVKMYMKLLAQETYSTTINSPVTYYSVRGTRCGETTVKTKIIYSPAEIGKASSLHLELGNLSIIAFYSSNLYIKHPLLIDKRSPTMTHNGCSGPGLEMERTSKSESFLKTFSIEYHLIASSDVNLVIPDLIWGADETAGYGHNGAIFENTNEIIKIEGLKCDIAKLPNPITSYKETLEIKTFIETIAKYSGIEWAKPSKPTIEWVSIPAGTFTMGSPITEVDKRDNETQHQVTLSAFKISKYEVTFEQYDLFCEATGRSKPDDRGWGREDRPVVVSWDDATAFAEWIGCRLPTEAEWEYTCRAGTTTQFNTGNNLTTEQANFNGNYPYNENPTGVYKRKTMPVWSYLPNAWGLYNMHGNEDEWCSDWYGDYSAASQTNPKGPTLGKYHVIRGGSYCNTAFDCRSANRLPGYGIGSGIRLVSTK